MAGQAGDVHSTRQTTEAPGSVPADECQPHSGASLQG